MLLALVRATDLDSSTQLDSAAELVGQKTVLLGRREIEGVKVGYRGPTYT